MHATLGTLLHSFAENDQLRLIALLWGADLILGVLAAVATHTFRLSYIADTLRNDGLKVFTWFVLFSLGKASGGTDIVGPVDFGTAADGAFLLLTASLAGSILSSVKTLGVPMPEVIAGNEKTPVVTNTTTVVNNPPTR